LPWFAVNMPVEPSIKRFQSLWDKHILSHLGNYTHALRLTRYYDSQNDTLREIDVWDKYSRLYPEDPRGYVNEVQMLDMYAHDNYLRKAATYERWIKAAPNDDTLRLAYASMCVNGGNKYFHEQKYDIAKLFYLKALIADDQSALAYNNLGSVYAQEGKLDTAATLFGKAISLDSMYAEAYYNNGNVLIDQGKKQVGLALIQRAARLGNPQAVAYVKQKK
jgi:tetratricopeptide (TPR) repeat protein